jgi:hypothetical protein
MGKPFPLYHVYQQRGSAPPKGNKQIMTTYTIARHTYRNGRFGNNTAGLTRVDGGWTVCNGYSDPFFYRNVVDAKRAYRLIVSMHP